jgi:hypothetical protein
MEGGSMSNDAQTLAIRDEQALALRPREVIAGATEQATVLMEIVQARKLFATVGGKMYLEAEAWEVICAFNNVAPDVVYVKPIYENDEVVAYEAKVNLVDRSGALRGSGIAECSLDSFPTKGRVGRDKDKAAKSAAQTWAISKAARMAFSWVAVLAGFEPTPASEMKGGPAPSNGGNDYGICPKHNVPYFKRGAMTSPGHKDDTTKDKWCNRPDDDADFAAKAPSAYTEPVSEPEGTEVLGDGGVALAADSLEGPLFHKPAESDGGPALSLRGDHFADVGAFRKALKDNFGLATTAEVNKALDEAGLGPLAELGNLDEAYANLAAHRGQPTKNKETA